MRGDITKLPKWAQAEIRRLERDLESAHQKLRAGPEDSNTFADPYGETERPLGDSPNIVFKWGDTWSDRITARLEGEEVVLMGGEGIVVYPRASNTIHVRTGRLGS